jgi:exopolysaccharide biosynthesis polyprenyl glycosylphosphotransferase
VTIATGLLVFTHRRGRRVRRPSETVAVIGMRIALAPMIAMSPYWDRTVNTDLWIALVAFTVPAVLIGRLLMFKLIHSVRARGFDLEDTIVVGAGPVGREVVEALEHHPEMGLLPVGFIDRYSERLPLPLLGRPEDLLEILEDTGARHVVLAFGAAPEVELVAHVRRCSHLPVRFYTIPRFFELGVSDRSGIEVDGFTLIPLGRPGHHHIMWPIKRAIDLAISSVLLVLTAPVFAACALAVRLSGPGPIFFRQERVSVDNIPFEMLKFRTMRYVADPAEQARLDQRAQAVNLDDDRITSIGKFLRQSHLDELPQLLNVVRGDMALVGPRPERPYFVDKHSDEVSGYAYRHRVPAGITGWAQVNGFWGDSSLETRVRLDNRYIENWSPWRDLMIGLRTIPTLFGRRR